jgi:hypothetical protein
MTYSTITSNTGLTVDYRWIVFSLTHSQSTTNLLSASETPFLQSGSQNKAQVDVKGAWREIQGAAGASYESTNDTQLSSRQERFYTSATYPYSYYLSFSFNADKLMSQYQNPERSSDSNSMRLTATWYPMDDMIVNADIGRRSRNDSKQATETMDEASVKAQMKYGKMAITSSLTANRRVRGSSEQSNWRFDLSMIRYL